MKITQLFKRVSQILSICIFLGGSVVLIGWILDIPVLKSISPNFVAMKANTAICFIFIGLSLWLLQTTSQDNRLARGIARLCAFAVFLIGFLTFLEYVLEWDFGIDQLLFKESATAILTSSPGRMAFNASIILGIIGTALLLCGYETALFIYLAQLLVIPAGILDLLSFIGYLYGASPLYIGEEFSTAQALHTCILFLMSCIGCLFARPEQGLMKDISSDNYGGFMLRRILPVVIAIPLVLGWFEIYGEKTGLFGNKFGVSFVTTGNLFIVGLFVYILSAYLNRLDVKRKLTETVLQTEKNNLEAVFEASPVGMLLLNEKYEVTKINGVIEKLVGQYRLGDQPGNLFRCIHSLEDPKGCGHSLFCPKCPIRNAIKTTLDHGHSAHCAEVLSTFLIDGKKTDIWLEVNAEPVVLDGKKCVIVAIDNITTRKLTETALKESEAKYKTLFSTAVEGILVADVKKKQFLYCNPAICKMLGYTEEELMHLNVGDIHPKEALIRVLAEFEAMVRGEKKSTEVPCLHKNGTVFDVSISASGMAIGERDSIVGFFTDITERKRAEEELLFKTTLLEAQSEETIDGILVVDDYGKVILSNKHFRSMWNISQQLIGTKDDERLLQYVLEQLKDSDEFLKKVKYLYLNRDEKSRDEIQLKNGKVFDRYSSPMIDSNGVYRGRIWYFRDITDRKQAEETVRENSELYHALFEQANDAIFLMENEYFVDCNERALEMFGVTREQIINQPPIRFSPEFQADGRRSAEKMMEKIHAAYAGEPQFFEWTHTRLDGTPFDAEVSLGFIKIGGRPLLQAIVRNITDRKQAEKTQKRLVTIIEATPDFVGFADAKDKHIIYVNRAGRKMCGIGDDEDVTKLKFYDVHPEWTNKMYAEEILPVAMRDGVWMGECAFLNIRTRHEIPVLMVLSSHKAPNGEVEVFSTISRNITDRKLAEESLKQAKTQAEAANEAKSRFLANISHEMRTPLNAIIGFSKILMQEELSEEHKEQIKMVYNSGGHLLGLINDILNISSIEAEMNIEMKQSSLEQLIANIESMMQPIAAEKGLTFEIREKGDLPANIVTDAARLQQCLTNLVNNAIKFTEQGHVYVNISLKDKDSKPCICFEIEDTGIGIAAQSQQKIFEPFFQEDVSTSRKYGGTGLGLTIARKFAGLLGGEITFTSEEGKGSVFSLIIPAGLDLAAQPLLNRHKIIDDASKVKENRFSGCILVAEDVKTNQMLMKLLLEKMGLKVTIAENGAEAVDKALGQKFDLIFMDIQMPKLNGYEATRTLRDKGIKIPIVALTAGTMEGDEKKCIEAGCDIYLSKPVVFSKLIETLSKYLPLENQALIEAVSSASSKAD